MACSWIFDKCYFQTQETTAAAENHICSKNSAFTSKFGFLVTLGLLLFSPWLVIAKELP